MTQQPRRQQSSGGAMAEGLNQASYGLSVALGFVGVVMLFWFAGRLLDGWLDTEPWAQVAGAIVGWVLGVVVVVYAAQRPPR